MDEDGNKCPDGEIGKKVFETFMEMTERVAREGDFHKNSHMLAKIMSVMLHGKAMKVGDIESELILVGVNTDQQSLENVLQKAVLLGVLDRQKSSGAYKVQRDVVDIFQGLRHSGHRPEKQRPRRRRR